jgi:hypothetical protein
MTDDERVSATTRVVLSCKGSALAILITLLASNQPLGNGVIQSRTGYDVKTVAKGLQQLGELGFAQRHARYDGWFPTSHAKQLGLPVPELEEGSEQGELDINEVEILHLPSSSSSLINVNPKGGKTTTTTTGEVEILHLPQESTSVAAMVDDPAEQAIDLLCSETTCPAATARAAVKAAHAFWDPIQIQTEICYWLAWIKGRQGIDSPGHYIASRIKAGRSVPEAEREPEHESSDGRKRQYVPRGYEDLIEH